MRKVQSVKYLIAGALVVAGLFGIRSAAHAALLFTYPQEYQAVANDTLVVDIRLDSKLDPVNVVKGTLLYPTDLLAVEDVSYRGSFLTLWIQQPTVDAKAGTVTFLGGVPHGSYVAGGRVMTVTFRALSQGTAKLVFDQGLSSVLLNDGKGTKAPLQTQQGTYYIVDALTSIVRIDSSTHPDENTWYPFNLLKVHWDPKPGASYSYVLSKDPFETPDDLADSAIGDVQFTDLDDGAYYFTLKELIPGHAWSVVGRRRALIDRIGPTGLEYKIGSDPTAYGGKTFLAFTASDAASGIDHFDVVEGNTVTSPATSPYILADQTRHKGIILRVYDKAGNMTEATVSQSSPITSSTATFIVVGAGIVLGAIVVIWIRTRKRKKEQ